MNTAGLRHHCASASKSLCSRSSAWSLQTRSVSSSPYGRTHVWKRREPTLPNPLPPKFPQRVIRADGSSFTHWTTSPRSILRLTRDTTNHPVWNTYMWADDEAVEDEANTTGRVGRFNKKFEGIGGHGEQIDFGEAVKETMDNTTGGKLEGELVDPSKYVQKKKKKDRRRTTPSYIIGQDGHENILRTTLENEYGCKVELGTEFIAFEQYPDYVVVHLQKTVDGEKVSETATFSFLASADGARSQVRKQLGLSFLRQTITSPGMLVGDLDIKGLDRKACIVTTVFSSPLLLLHWLQKPLFWFLVSDQLWMKH
ncbi:hypothetical protein D9758_005577 [Tetrapyrgos nigripes]|uniref:FAD-binding domain-containing protein n=1 Tax=Tetrapyrgos nigripes TaxID=182062 RepID=A0A8H5LPG4_9AGAR|nr:hypothetical protein D9758_005577 [Tetrapyrgos nigripes]